MTKGVFFLLLKLPFSISAIYIFSNYVIVHLVTAQMDGKLLYLCEPC